MLVDDRSEDKTAEIGAAWMNRWDRLRAVRAPDKPAFACPKKSALAVGIASAKGEDPALYRCRLPATARLGSSDSSLLLPDVGLSLGMRIRWRDLVNSTGPISGKLGRWSSWSG